VIVSAAEELVPLGRAGARTWPLPLPCGSAQPPCYEPRNAEEVVRCANHPRGHLGPLLSFVTSPSEVGDGLGPAENLFDSLANALADGVAGVAGRTGIDRRSPVLGNVLGYVRGDVHVSAGTDEVGRVVVLVAAQGHISYAVFCLKKKLE